MPGDGQGQVVLPGGGSQLDADGEAFGGGAAADHGAWPAGQAPGGGPADGVLEVGGFGGAVGWGGQSKAGVRMASQAVIYSSSRARYWSQRRRSW
jgi:hypothetical protein